MIFVNTAPPKESPTLMKWTGRVLFLIDIGPGPPGRAVQHARFFTIPSLLPNLLGGGVSLRAAAQEKKALRRIYQLKKYKKNFLSGASS
jgi:hypothetical protein